MDNGLVVFLKSSEKVEKEDIDIILHYKLAKVCCVIYDYKPEMLDELEGLLSAKGKRVEFIKADGDFDTGLIPRIRSVVATNADITSLDITFASPYHAGYAMNLGGSGQVEVWASTYDDSGSVKRLRIDRTKCTYSGLSDTCYMLLDIMSIEPIYTEAAMEELGRKFHDSNSKSRGKTAIYTAFEQMASMGLIDRCAGVLPEGYKSRKPNFFRLNDDQQWDYLCYKAMNRRRMAELDEIRRKKSAARQSKKESKKLGPMRRRTNQKKG